MDDFLAAIVILGGIYIAWLLGVFEGERRERIKNRFKGR